MIMEEMLKIENDDLRKMVKHRDNIIDELLKENKECKRIIQKNRDNKNKDDWGR